jgi:hypothetical protein
VLRRTFGQRRVEVRGGWRKLHNELHNFAKYNHNGQAKEDEIGRPCSKNGEKWNACRLLVEKPGGKIRLGRPRRG